MRVIKTMKEKFKAKVARMSITLAQRNDDPLFKKYQKHRSIFMKTKARLILKYASRAATEVRAQQKEAANKPTP